MLQFLAAHGYAVLFGVLLVEQLGAPLPAAPLLVAAGALARMGQLDAAAALSLAVLASLIGHGAWFFAGRLAGTRVLRLLCSISLEPDSCVRRTQETFTDRGPLTLILAPWVPGLGGVAAPLAGMSPMGLGTFLLIDGFGALLYSGAFVALGLAFGDRLEAVFALAARFGGWFALAAGIAVALYVGYKLRERRRVLRDLALSRIEAGELKALLDGGATVLIVDMRHPVEMSAGTLPGAVPLSLDALEERAQGLPRDRDVVLYCS